MIPRLFDPPLKILGESVPIRKGLILSHSFYNDQNEQISQNAEVPYIAHLFKGSWQETYDQAYLWQQKDIIQSPLPQIQYALSQFSIPKSMTNKVKKQGLWILKKCENPLESFFKYHDQKKLSHYKIKIGRYRSEFEIIEIKKILEEAPKDILFRFDANRLFSKKLLERWWLELKRYHRQIEYFEEPLFEFRDYDSLPIPIALDELVIDWLQDKRLQKLINVKALVIKPALWGDLNLTLEKLKRTKQDIVISSTYEGKIGHHANSWLASHFPDQAHGLDTLL